MFGSEEAKVLSEEESSNSRNSGSVKGDLRGTKAWGPWTECKTRARPSGKMHHFLTIQEIARVDTHIESVRVAARPRVTNGKRKTTIGNREHAFAPLLTTWSVTATSVILATYLSPGSLNSQFSLNLDNNDTCFRSRNKITHEKLTPRCWAQSA